MNILLINPSVGYYTRALSNPLGLLSIGTYLKHHGHNVQIYDRCVNRQKLNKILKDFIPDVAGISVMSSRGLKDAIKISKALKERGITVIWGGQLPSMQTDTVLKNNFVDAVSIGEGEITWKEIADNISSPLGLEGIHGIAYKKDGETIYNPSREFADLSDFPISDWSLIDVKKYLQTYMGCSRMMYLYSSKGCPCCCAFCSNAVFHKSTHRKRPTEHVIEEIKFLTKNYGVDGIFFSDELWCIKRSDMLEFCRIIRENSLDFHWGIQLRIGMFDKEDFKTMYDAGCRWILFGIESGSKEMLKKIKKNIDFDKIAPTFKILKEIGYITIASFIVGFPGETEKQIKETIKLINDADASFSTLYHFTPLPGTEFFNELLSEGKINNSGTIQEMCKTVATESMGMNYSCVPDRDLKVIRCWYNWKGFTNKNALKTGKSFDFAKQTVSSGLHAISLKGPISFWVNGFTALHEFIYIFWYSHMYPKTIKKYGLK
ncbi:MAG: B12-binding domain-containing radical SAM protein [Clostridia bacterium]|nr:B12-binding domain-containing radical SAM protein [Clostridia bacterium]